MVIKHLKQRTTRLGKEPWSRVVLPLAKDSPPRGHGFEPLCEDHFSSSVHLNRSMDKTFLENSCIRCNPANGREVIEEHSAYRTK